MNTAEQILEQNETDANLFAGKFLLITAAASLLLTAFYFTSGLSTWSNSAFIIASTLLMQILRIFLYFLIRGLQGRSAGLKYLITLCLILTAVVDSLLFVSVSWTVFVLPILYSIRYGKKRFTLCTGIFCVVISLIMSFVMVYYGFKIGTPSLNFVALTEDVTLPLKAGYYGIYKSIEGTGLLDMKYAYNAALFESFLPVIILSVITVVSYLMVQYNSSMVEKEIDYFETICEKEENITEMQQKVVLGLADLIENRDSNTGGHVKRTSEIIRIIVDEYREMYPGVLDEQAAMDIVRAAPMHDLGKIEIDSNILNKPGKLTDEEFGIMKSHSSKSDEIVKIILDNVEEDHFVTTAHHVARSHHERWDGRGYPDRLQEKQIPLEARIMAVADVYDALVSKRVYKQPMSFEQAEKIMREGMGSQFDPQLEAVFSACREKLEAYYSEVE